MEEHSLTVQAVLKNQRSNARTGLSSVEAARRLESFGKNKLASKKKVSPFKIFISQFRSFIIYILLFAVVISLIAGEVVDATVIFIILLFNSFFGFFQEYKAERAIDALKKLSSLRVRVVRDGKTVDIDADSLVPGDIMLLEAGNKISADARIVEAHGFEVSEASLTGESVPVSKHEKIVEKKSALAEMKNVVFSGTTVTRGKARVVVVHTGMDTEIGSIAKMVSQDKDELTPLQRNLESLGKWVGIVTIIICAIIFITGVVKEDHISLLFAGDFIGFIFAAKVWFLTAISLAVAAVPEGLPIVVTIALAIGTRKMLRKNALIRKLPSVETLGETSVICTDKTGTLTKNQMTVRKVFVNNNEFEFTGEGYDLNGGVNKKLTKDDLLLFQAGVFCNDSELIRDGSKYRPRGDPTEIAFLVSAAKAGINAEKLRQSWKALDEIPFDSKRKMMSVLRKDPASKKRFVFSKGAPEAILDKCTKIKVGNKIVPLTRSLRNKILSRNDAYASNALRVLGFAYKPHTSASKNFEENLVFLGLQAMIDPPHKEVKQALARCRSAGIRVIMMTGDNIRTAQAIGREIGITGSSMLGSSFDKLSAKQKAIAVRKTNIFARVEPDHKLEIVRLLQDAGAIVAMTGDGVNDAPAVKHANLGIAMGIAGSDVTKESSEMVLQDDNFVSIVDAVEEGRGIYANIRKFVNYLFSSNIAEVLIVFFAILLGWDLPLTAIMLLWINLVTDGLPALALSVDPTPKNAMSTPPRKPSEGIMTKSMTVSVLYVSVLIAVAVLILFNWYRSSGLAVAQTVAFSALIVMELVRLQTIRSESQNSMFSNKYLVLAVIASLGLQLLVIYSPLSAFFGTVSISLSQWGSILLASAAVLVCNTLGGKVIKKVVSNGN